MISDGGALPGCRRVRGSHRLGLHVEHVANPAWLAAELSRILKPGGWICARTPNKYGYISVFARLVPDSLHDVVLRIVQPQKKSIDTFPTLYRLNTRRDLRRYFSEYHFEHVVFEHDSEPAYVANSALGWRVGLFLTRILPRRFYTMLFVFLRKKGHEPACDSVRADD